MDATQNARSFSQGSLRRYVLDTLAVGRSVSIQTSNSDLVAGLVAIGNRLGAKISVVNASGPGKSMIINVESAAGSAYFDLYTMN
jgi:hypothetical protein